MLIPVKQTVQVQGGFSTNEAVLAIQSINISIQVTDQKKGTTVRNLNIQTSMYKSKAAFDAGESTIQPKDFKTNFSGTIPEGKSAPDTLPEAAKWVEANMDDGSSKDTKPGL